MTDSPPPLFTLTGNLLAERTLTFPAWSAGRTQRATAETFQVGGKGINVAKMLTRLGAANTALGFTGGATGEDCLAWLRRSGLAFRTFPSTTPTRTGTVIRASGQPETTFLGPDAAPDAAALRACADFLDAQPAGLTLAFCGSFPGWASPDFDVVRAALTRWITEWRNALRERMNRLDGQALSRAVDSLLNYETVKYFAAEQREQARYAQATRAYADAAVKSENSLGLLNIAQASIVNLLMAGAMAYTVWGWSQGRLTVGDVVFVNTYLTQLFRPLDMLGMVYRTIRQGLIDMAEMFKLMDTDIEVRDVPGAPALVVRRPTVAFDNVVFGYDRDRTILHGLSFEVPAGHQVAIVGPSGAGKSTIGRLLFRFYDPWEGRILIDGQDIAQVTQTSLRVALGIVPQDSVLFNDTIGYNIAYGRDGSSEAEMIAAARDAAILPFIEALPKGFSTQVGERGLKLSGGEKQRVAIARTLVKNPPILLLDEATSALDTRTEQEILATLHRVSTGRTSLSIAHRLSTIADADTILVLDQGRLAESGTHADLLRRDGLYADMWSRQAAESSDLEQAAE